MREKWSLINNKNNNNIKTVYAAVLYLCKSVVNVHRFLINAQLDYNVYSSLFLWPFHLIADYLLTGVKPISNIRKRFDFEKLSSIVTEKEL